MLYVIKKMISYKYNKLEKMSYIDTTIKLWSKFNRMNSLPLILHSNKEFSPESKRAISDFCIL